MSRPTLFQRVREVFSPCQGLFYPEGAPTIQIACAANLRRCVDCPRRKDVMLGGPAKNADWRSIPRHWVTSVQDRAKTSLLAEVCMPSAKPGQFEFWRGAVIALGKLTNGQAAALAAKDSHLPYEPPGVIKAAADVLDGDWHLLTRVEIEHQLERFGVKVPLDFVANSDRGDSHQLKNVDVPSGDLNSKKTAQSVEGNDGSSGHADSVGQGAAA